MLAITSLSSTLKVNFLRHLITLINYFYPVPETEIAMPQEEWRWRMYYHHSLYAKGRTWASAYELHLRDPTVVMYKAIYKAIGNIGLPRKTLMARCHLFADQNVPEHLMNNVCDQIRQIQEIPRKLEEYNEKEIQQFPKIVDLPEDFTVFKPNA